MENLKIIEKILKDEDFKKALNKTISKIEKQDSEPRVYDLTENVNYPLCDFEFKGFINCYDCEIQKVNTMLGYQNYNIVKKYHNKCVIQCYDNNPLKSDDYVLFIAEYIGEEEF